MADINRTDALALINQQNSNEIFQEAAKTSTSLASFRRVNMGTKQYRMPVLDALPTAGFVSGDSGRKLTSEMAWASKVLEAEEIAVIVPIPENVFDDTEFNVWEEVRPRIAEAVGKTLDGAVFFSTNKPASWPEGLVPAAKAAGNVFYTAAVDPPDLAERLNQTIALVEADGYDPTDIYATRALRVALRGLRDDNGRPLYNDSVKQGDVAGMYGLDLRWVNNTSWVSAEATALVGDSSKAILGIRQDMTFKILDQATLTDGAGAVVFALAEQDMIALRCKFRVGFQVADPTTLEGGTSAYPFAVLDPDATA